MKKLAYSLLGLTLCFGMTQMAFAADLAQTAAGDQVTITVTTGNPPFDAFTPSTNVIMDGATSAAGFAAAAYHSQVFQKKSGKEFGMASDSSAMWYNDISAANATATTVASTDSAVFSGNWEKM